MTETTAASTRARKRIAIVGGGIAGAAAAWRLGEVHEVTLFEARDRLGGHVHTASSAGAPADLGVIIVNQRTYPNLAAVYQRLGVATRPVALTVQACFGSSDHWGTNCRDTPLFREVEAECRAFEDAMGRGFDVPMVDFSVTLGAYCDRLGLSETFRRRALLPLLLVLQLTRGSLWETPVVFVRPLFRLGALSFFEPPSGWMMLEGGTQREIEALTGALRDRVRLGVRVTRVERGDEGSVTVHGDGALAGGERFDEVILACPLDAARELIDADADPAERAALSPERLRYERMKVFLHSDPRVVTRGTPEPWLIQYNATERGGSVTFNPHQASLDGSSPAQLVTYCHDEGLAPAADRVQETVTFSHLMSTPAACEAALALGAINGRRHTWYAGHSCALPPNWHEGAFVSGLVVAVALGAPYPFRGDVAAERVFAMVSMVMGASG